MSNSKRALLSSILAGVAGLVLLAGPARAVSPAAQAGVTSVIDRSVVKDRSGVVFPNGNDDVGWKVWVSTDANPHQVTDELGNVVTCGEVRTIMLSSGTTSEYGVAYDSGSATNSLTTTNQATNIGFELVTPVMRLAALPASPPQNPFAQFDTGLVVLMSGNSNGTASMKTYWRPCRGGGN